MESILKIMQATSPFAEASGDSPPKPKAKENISYLSELTPHPEFISKVNSGCGINSPKQLTFTVVP
jgi:hypothetical protein